MTHAPGTTPPSTPPATGDNCGGESSVVEVEGIRCDAEPAAADEFLDGSDGWDPTPRCDYGELVAPEQTTDGFMRYDARVASPGILHYPKADGSMRREFVPREVIEASNESLKNRPVTIEHPTKAGRIFMLTPATAARFQRGMSDSNVRLDEMDYQRVSLMLTTQDALDAVRKGKREISLGYRVKTEAKPGTHPIYGAYDVIQTAREINHIAITGSARGGSGLQLRADSAVPPEGDGSMDKEMLKLLLENLQNGKLDDVKRQLEEIRADSEDWKGKAEAAATDLKTEKSAHEETKGTLAGVKTELKELKDAEQTRADAAPSADEVKAADIKSHQEWGKLHGTAKKLEIERADSMDVDELREAIVRAKVEDLPEGDLDPQFIKGVFATLKMDDDTSNKRVDSKREDPKTFKQTPKDDPDEDLRSDAADAWGAAMDAQFKQRKGA